MSSTPGGITEISFSTPGSLLQDTGDVLAVLPEKTNRQEEELNRITDFSKYLNALLHGWLQTLTALGFTLYPAFFLLDWIMIPAGSRQLLPLFGLFRLLTTLFIILQYFQIRHSRPSRWSFIHGYIFTLIGSFAIVLMTVLLGGFNSPYYAGLNLVIIAVNLLLPWHGLHSMLNGLVTVSMYLFINTIWGGHYDSNLLVNNLYFLFSTVIIASSINHVKFKLIRREFEGRQQLQQARDALWGEMEIAKRIQTALLPFKPSLTGFEIEAAMLPANEVGGDYYDLFEYGGCGWVFIGDVSGHGVESGLIMMMTQTSIQSIVRSNPQALPSQVLDQLNQVLKENMARLGSDRYLTLSALRIEDSAFTFAGKHQDILIYRKATGGVETIPTEGAWIGAIDRPLPFLTDRIATLQHGDTMVLFTDGVTEAMNENGDMFGEERLVSSLRAHAKLPTEHLLYEMIQEINNFQKNQSDDITLVILRKKQ